MFDPSTVAFEIKYPWKRPSKLFPKGYRDTFIIIWHEDPCADGSDDSCGWSSPKLTKDEADKIKREAKFEMKYWFDISDTGVLTPKTSAESIVYQAFMMIAWRVWQKQIKAKHLPEIMSVTYNHMDNFSDTFRGRWGELKEDDFLRSCHFIGRCFKRMERKWYQHPRFHIHHWRIQIRPWQQFKRWAFARCCFCKKGFKWNESVIGSWGGESIWHNNCNHHTEVQRDLR